MNFRWFASHVANFVRLARQKTAVFGIRRFSLIVFKKTAKKLKCRPAWGDSIVSNFKRVGFIGGPSAVPVTPGLSRLV